MAHVDEKLLEFATLRQKEIITKLNELGSGRATARHFGVNHKTIQDALKSVTRKAAVQGYSPDHDMTRTVPEPYVVKGTSTYYDRDGKPAQQWVKTRLSDEKYHEMLRAIADGMADELPRLAPTKAQASEGGEDLANLYVMTDAHIGMLASEAEGGAKWDLQIAEATLTRVFAMMLDRAPAARVGIIGQLGDWLHFDGFTAVTDRGGHVLDASARFHDVMQAGVRILRRLIDGALQQHDSVVVVLAEGNHDQRSANWFQVMFRAIYENEPRVTVIETPKPYYAIQHGRTALFFTHGHLAKGQALGLLFASEFSAIWGATDHRYGNTGHLHSVDENGLSGIRLVQHPTLAARDAYSARGGWLSERQASVISYHKKFGEVGRVVVTPEMFQLS